MEWLNGHEREMACELEIAVKQTNEISALEVKNSVNAVKLFENLKAKTIP